MKLDTFSVKHYKSLSDVTVKFDPNVTVIVGANSVGKSNFVDAMRFLRDAVKDDLDHAMVSRGGVARIGQRMGDASESPSFIGFEVAAIQTFVSHPPEQVSYSLSLGTSQSGDGAFKVQQESAACFDEDFELFGRNDSPILLHDGFDRKPDGHITVNDGVSPPETYRIVDFDRLAIGERFGKARLVSIALAIFHLISIVIARVKSQRSDGATARRWHELGLCGASR
jgi:AAA ATPase domain